MFEFVGTAIGRVALSSTLAIAAVFPGSPAIAEEFRLEPATFPAPMVGPTGRPDGVIEASAVEPIGDGKRFLIAHDRSPALHVVDAATGRLVGEPITSTKFPPLTNKFPPKWEGMALDGDGNYYVIGAHVGKTDEERAAKSALYRFRLKDGDGPAPAIDDDSVIRWDVSRSLEAVLRAEGLDPARVARRKVEGLTIRDRKAGDGSTRRELVVGLREPSDRTRAFAADITSPPSPGAELDLEPVFSFEAGSREGVASQLTSLEHVPGLGGFLAVTATEDQANTFHGNTLWFVPDGETRVARKVADFEVSMKAEGLAVLGVVDEPRGKSVSLLISYDNDPHVTHIPSRFQKFRLVRERR